MLLSAADVLGNDLADRLAKAAVEYHRVAAEDVRIWKQHITKAYWRAAWIGKATDHANDLPEFPFKDSEAARWRADAAKRAQETKKLGKIAKRRRARNLRAPLDGLGFRHSPVEQGSQDRQLWRCSACKQWSASLGRLTRSRCPGDVGAKWMSCGTSPGSQPVTSEAKRMHCVLKSGSITWCSTCGAFAEAKAVGLLGQCSGPPPPELGSGGRKAQLNRMRANRHPVTGQPMPHMTPEVGGVGISPHMFAPAPGDTVPRPGDGAG